MNRYEVSTKIVGVIAHHPNRDTALIAAARYAKANETPVTVCDRMARKGMPRLWTVRGPLKEMLSNQTMPVDGEVAEWRS